MKSTRQEMGIVNASFPWFSPILVLVNNKASDVREEKDITVPPFVPVSITYCYMFSSYSSMYWIPWQANPNSQHVSNFISLRKRFASSRGIQKFYNVCITTFNKDVLIKIKTHLSALQVLPLVCSCLKSRTQHPHKMYYFWWKKTDACKVTNAGGWIPGPCQVSFCLCPL